MALCTSVTTVSTAKVDYSALQANAVKGGEAVGEANLMQCIVVGVEMCNRHRGAWTDGACVSHSAWQQMCHTAFKWGQLLPRRPHDKRSSTKCVAAPNLHLQF